MTRRSVVLIACVWLFLPVATAAQTLTTADGVASFVRGDYERAVAVLQPAAERWVGQPFDDTAAFFMAMMYDNGIGVAPDPVRACALLLRSSFSSRPFIRSAVMTLAEDLQKRLGPDQLAWCQFFSDIGFDHRFKPVTFTLETGTWIELNLAVPNRALMARIVSGGTANEVEVHVPWVGGMRFLPFRLTEVTALRPSLLQRHFLEIFMWKPVRRNRWTLTWVVSEAARGTLAPILVEDVWTIEADQPPADEAIDVTRLAGIRINALGDAEWVVLDEKNPRSGAIATPAERDEVAALERAARAAEANLDPSVR